MNTFVKKLSGAVALMWLATAGFAVPAAAENYSVVVNAGNTFSGDTGTMKEQIKRMYLKQQSTWPGSQAAEPFGRPVGSPAHAALLQGVLGMSQTELTAHWARLKQTTGDTPPREVPKVRQLMRQIAKSDGGFSVITEKEAKKQPAKVRTLFRFELN